MAIKKLCIPFVSKDAIDDLVNTIIIQDGRPGIMVEEPGELIPAENIVAGKTYVFKKPTSSSMATLTVAGTVTAHTGTSSGYPASVEQGKVKIDDDLGLVLYNMDGTSVVLDSNDASVTFVANQNADVPVSIQNNVLEVSSSTLEFKAFKLED